MLRDSVSFYSSRAVREGDTGVGIASAAAESQHAHSRQSVTARRDKSWITAAEREPFES